jgi:hypothetical protein
MIFGRKKRAQPKAPKRLARQEGEFLGQPREEEIIDLVDVLDEPGTLEPQEDLFALESDAVVVDLERRREALGLPARSRLGDPEARLGVSALREAGLGAGEDAADRVDFEEVVILDEDEGEEVPDAAVAAEPFSLESVMEEEAGLSAVPPRHSLPFGTGPGREEDDVEDYLSSDDGVLFADLDEAGMMGDPAAPVLDLEDIQEADVIIDADWNGAGAASPAVGTVTMAGGDREEDEDFLTPPRAAPDLPASAAEHGPVSGEVFETPAVLFTEPSDAGVLLSEPLPEPAWEPEFVARKEAFEEEGTGSRTGGSLGNEVQDVLPVAEVPGLRGFPADEEEITPRGVRGDKPGKRAEPFPEGVEIDVSALELITLEADQRDTATEARDKVPEALDTFHVVGEELPAAGGVGPSLVGLIAQMESKLMGNIQQWIELQLPGVVRTALREELEVLRECLRGQEKTEDSPK